MNSVVNDENRLIDQIRKGDIASYEILVKRYESRIFYHCLKFLGNHEDAEDVLQESFLKAFRALDSFRGDAAFPTWLYKIATNGCLLKIRQRKRRDAYSLDEPIETGDSFIQRELADWSNDPALQVDGDEVRQIIDMAINNLPDDKRIVLVLKDIENMPNKEIGELLGISLSAVKSRLHRARLVLRSKLNDYLSDAKSEVI